jgi:hypothetical protein
MMRVIPFPHHFFPFLDFSEVTLLEAVFAFASACMTFRFLESM